MVSKHQVVCWNQWFCSADSSITSPCIIEIGYFGVDIINISATTRIAIHASNSVNKNPKIKVDTYWIL